MSDSTKRAAMDANEAVAAVAYPLNELIAIFPITPASVMGELSDQWAADGRPNLWGIVPKVVEMQSEGGAAGAIHGGIQAGVLGTTFTASQGLLLMLPNMYKIAGELTPVVFHVAARTLATHALSIFGDHSDVMSARSTGFAMLASASVQEAQDFALIAQAATLESRVPFLHFFDGFRTSHEIAKIQVLDKETLSKMISDEAVRVFRSRALTPDKPVMRGTAQNPDVFFQAREACNPFYLACPAIVQSAMDKFAALTGRAYSLFEYHGAPDAERVIVIIGSGAETARETVDYLNARNERAGVLKVHLFRPFSVPHFLEALPLSVQTIAVLDRTKEPGSIGEPLYLDIVAALNEGEWVGRNPRVIGGRYGLSSKEFTPAMVKAVFDELTRISPKNHFTVGIHDDVTHTSLDYDPAFSTETEQTFRAVFYGLGSDGTVSANKNSIKIISDKTDQNVQGYFVYDSKKSGSVTISHLRFGPDPIRSAYLISEADFVACHQSFLLERLDVLKIARPGAMFLLNSFYDADTVWQHLPARVQEQIAHKKLRFYVINAGEIAREAGIGGRINTIMQTCFFALTKVVPLEQAVTAMKEAIEKSYKKHGPEVLKKNFAAVDAALNRWREVSCQSWHEIPLEGCALVSDQAPEFVQRVTARILAGLGDELPVSALPPDGTFPTATSQWEKRNIARIIPVWDTDLCIQCGKCVLVCPHAAIRAKVYEPKLLAEAPGTFKAAKARWRNPQEQSYTLQVSPEDCTGCDLCVQICPVKSKTDPAHKALNMQPQAPLRDTEKESWEFFLELPEAGRQTLDCSQVKDVQLLQPLFEFSGACAGCGETPYLKLLSQLFGDRLLIANATGCSSIYGGNLPTTPWACNHQGRGPAWSNSLFEDNAEFGLGMKLAVEKRTEFARELLRRMAGLAGDELVRGILDADQSSEAGIEQQRERVAALKAKLEHDNSPDARNLLAVADALVKKSVWIVGGDGWAYDIDFGGLDHVLASGANVKMLVLDTEVYSNTGGQASKATPRGAVAKFAAGGKDRGKKDLALMMMGYGNIYIARVALEANDFQTIKAFREAEAFDGPSLIIAFSPCIAHGYNLMHENEHERAAVLSAYWPLFRYNPDLLKEGKNPLQLDSKPPALPLEKYLASETRYQSLAQKNPTAAHELWEQAQEDVKRRWKTYEQMAALPAK